MLIPFYRIQILHQLVPICLSIFIFIPSSTSFHEICSLATQNNTPGLSHFYFTCLQTVLVLAKWKWRSCACDCGLCHVFRPKCECKKMGLYSPFWNSFDIFWPLLHFKNVWISFHTIICLPHNFNNIFKLYNYVLYWDITYTEKSIQIMNAELDKLWQI